MSEKNVELLQDLFHAYETGDLERFAEAFHENAVMTGPSGWPEVGPFEGKEAMLRQFERLGSDWEEHHFSDLEVVADQDDWVVLTYSWHTRGASSGIATTAEMASAHRMVNGELVEVHFRWDRGDALEAAGLSG